MTFFDKSHKGKVNLRQLTAALFSQSAINTTSLSKLTSIGFILVALPLVTALLLSANKVSQLAKQSTNAIYHVAQLTQNNNKLDDTIAKMERSASQYSVLKDNELLSRFSRQQEVLADVIRNTVEQQQDEILITLLDSLLLDSKRIKALLLGEAINSLSLKEIQDEFKHLHTINERLGKQSNIVVNQQILDIHQTTESISKSILEGLYIIPITLIIAALFIILITNPLRRLTDKIKVLEQGSFEQKIHLHGPVEVREIADALENMRLRLHSLELQKSSFIRHISHELKTPLAAIREGTELIYDNSVGPLNSEQKEICDIIRSSVNRLQRLIEDLLDFNIVLDSTSLHSLETVNLAIIIADACNVRKLDIKSKNITLLCDNKPLHIYSNSKQLSVILDNVLSNAIKYSPINGNIQINYLASKQSLILTIIDQGPGIDAAHSNKVFDAFYQGKLPENSHIKGSGLGLTIVKELLLRLNGNIRITQATTSNDSVNQGARVTITLPNSQVENKV